MKKWLPVFALLAFVGCKPNEGDPAEAAKPEVTIKVDARYGDEDFQEGKVYNSNLGYRVRIDYFQSYISMMTLVKQDDTEVLVKDFSLVNWDDDPSWTFVGDPVDYKEIRFSIGVPTAYNLHVDPTTYPNSHPLSVQGSQGMFWTWNTGYIFTKFEGKADLEGVEGNPLLDPIAYHTGDNPAYRTVIIPITNGNVAAGDKKQFNLLLNVKEIIDNPNDQIDIAVDYLTHTSDNPELTARVADNFASAFSFIP